MLQVDRERLDVLATDLVHRDRHAVLDEEALEVVEPVEVGLDGSRPLFRGPEAPPEARLGGPERHTKATRRFRYDSRRS